MPIFAAWQSDFVNFSLFKSKGKGQIWRFNKHAYYVTKLVHQAPNVGGLWLQRCPTLSGYILIAVATSFIDIDQAANGALFRVTMPEKSGQMVEAAVLEPILRQNCEPGSTKQQLLVQMFLVLDLGQRVQHESPARSMTGKVCALPEARHLGGSRSTCSAICLLPRWGSVAFESTCLCPSQFSFSSTSLSCLG
ncbi:hypothetical protein Ciccas_002464 [Cichlidogyrus casuarinus]|uniref:Uncharacterized protein n=1 Tax=Cichlidogyrus casuarinus TaxID=1844966 RepID=A0ABD2QH50_9PLAT